MQLRTRLDHGGTPLASKWGIDSEYGRPCGAIRLHAE
jgi:hypothetical protein